MVESVFEIENLTCEYIAQKPVLHIKRLEVPRGKLIFVIGVSGIGKSTFIETLGFMNRTIAPSESLRIQFSPRPKSTPKDLSHYWSLSNDELSNFRRENFSFIFQNTNLMPNFTAGENMMFSLLLEGHDVAAAKKRVLEVMKLLSLDANIFDKKITELSGGQRQRLAFVRAVTSEFNVLFGDEPTGNLDEKTAADLMIVLKKILEDENKTGIIVSHDLDLALQFADVIIPITQSEIDRDTYVGEIDKSNIIAKHGGEWLKSGERCPDPRNYINSFLKRRTAIA